MYLVDTRSHATVDLTCNLCKSQKNDFPSRSNRQPMSSAQLKWKTRKQFSALQPTVAPFTEHKLQLSNFPLFAALITFFHFESRTSTSGLNSAQLLCTRTCLAPRRNANKDPSRTYSVKDKNMFARRMLTKALFCENACTLLDVPGRQSCDKESTPVASKDSCDEKELKG